jgi:hypothetical protein
MYKESLEVHKGYIHREGKREGEMDELYIQRVVKCGTDGEMEKIYLQRKLWS